MIIKCITSLCKCLLIPLLLGFPFAIIAYRLQWCELETAFTIIKFTAFASLTVLAIALLLVGLGVYQKQKALVKNCALIAIAMSIPVTGLFMQVIKAKSLPFLHQVSTDTINPPQFDVIIALRGKNSNPLAYDHAKLVPLQQAAYPELKTMTSAQSSELAFSQAVQTVQRLGWHIVNQNPEKGIIEAVDRTLLWGFKDDVVIRIQATEKGSNIDLRSISRVGGSDLGANAERIKRFMTEFAKH